jgi:hypothetical protein
MDRGRQNSAPIGRPGSSVVAEAVKDRVGIACGFRIGGSRGICEVVDNRRLRDLAGDAGTTVGVYAREVLRRSIRRSFNR